MRSTLNVEIVSGSTLLEAFIYGLSGRLFPTSLFEQYTETVKYS